jgi:hypothetical protein
MINVIINFFFLFIFRARKITSCYPDYAVQFDGIGAAPYGGEKLGCCSQMAIFYRKDMKTSPAKPIVNYLCNYFKLNS